MKKLILITGILLSTSLWAQPSDWVMEELIDKPISYMTYGLGECSRKLESDSELIPDVICSYDWNLNRLIFAQVEFRQQETLDISEALKICKTKLHGDLKMFSEGITFLMMLNLEGFSPKGYVYEGSGRREFLDDFVKRSIVTYQIIDETYRKTSEVWTCKWEFGIEEPSIRKSVEL